MSTQVTNRDQHIITAITELRAAHHACTLGAVAKRLKLSKAYLHEVVGEMKMRGLVDWSPEMIGSLHVTADIEQAEPALLPPPSGEPQPKPEPPQPQQCGVCGFVAKSGAGLVSHIRQKHG